MIAAVHITKGISWHGSIEEFENVYHFDGPVINTDSGWDELIDAVVAAEKPMLHSTSTFIRARVHGPTNTNQADDIMRRVRDLSGAGTAASGIVVAPELAVVASLYMGRSSRGYKRFLRKYVHGARIGGTGSTQSMADGISSLGTANKASFLTALQSLKSVSVGGAPNNLCTPQGDHIPAGEDWKVRDYVVTRQFRRGRKERR